MLNTDLHNPQIPHNKRMTKEQFLRNNKGINDNEDLPRDYLESLYDEIIGNQVTPLPLTLQIYIPLT